MKLQGLEQVDGRPNMTLRHWQIISHYSHLATRLKQVASENSLEWGADPQQVHFCSDRWDIFGLYRMNGQSYQTCDLFISGTCSVDQCRWGWLVLPANQKLCGFGLRRRPVSPITEHHSSERAVYSLNVHFVHGSCMEIE